MSEALARIGAEVTGLDACQDNIEAARVHTENDDSLHSLKYICGTIEEHCDEVTDQYDAVVASEVIEHVDNQELFVSKCSALVKESGSVFMTTISQTQLSWLTAIIGAEYVIGLLPRGTHDWNKFITPANLSSMLQTNNCRTHLVHGMLYNPVSNSWMWVGNNSVNYALQAVKTSN